MKAVFLRAIEAPVDEKAGVLRAAVPAGAATGTRFVVELESFRQVPRAPFAYWTSEHVRGAFRRHPRFHGAGRVAVSTNPLNDDPRFIRAWWEPCRTSSEARWRPWAKGGAFSPIYYDVDTVIQWDASRETYVGFLGTASRQRIRPVASVQYFFRSGLTWPRRTNGLSFRVLPAGSIFADKGPAAFVEGDDPAELLALCALINSQAFGALVQLQLARTELAQSYEVGLIQQSPIPDLPKSDQSTLAALARRVWSLKRELDTRTEISHAFVLPALLQVQGHTLQTRAQSWATFAASRQHEISGIHAQIDDRSFALYGIGPEDRRSIEAGFGAPAENEETAGENEDLEEDAPDEIDAAPSVVSLLSWSAGVAFGRFDVRLATSARRLPPEPDPFDPFPVCSPGMLTGEDGLPVDAAPPAYPFAFPVDGILVDDPGHPRDLINTVRAVFEEVFEHASARWHEATELVDARGGDLRNWFARNFFAEHVKRYSRSRRRAPIYWQLATTSASYSVWIYIHRATSDTLFRVLNDFVGPKLDHEREKLETAMRDAGPNPSRADRDALAAQEAFVDELQALRAEIARVAPLWNPDLDDGVILNFAPLWRLVPQEKSWQTECRKAWDKLAAAEYDWAQLAMHLWPERVVLKCATDRSLAIAHGLEDEFWRQDESGTWHPVEVAEAKVRKLITDRTSTTVKAALRDLLTAPAPSGNSGGRKAKGAPPRAPTPRRPAETVEDAADVDESTLEAVRAAIAAVPDGASKAEVQAATGLSDADWNRAIAALLHRGAVTRSGQKRGTRYRVGGA